VVVRVPDIIVVKGMLVLAVSVTSLVAAVQTHPHHRGVVWGGGRLVLCVLLLWGAGEGVYGNS